MLNLVTDGRSDLVIVYDSTDRMMKIRVQKFVEQIGNPYCYLDGDVVVSLGFSDTGVCLKDQLKALASNIG